MVGGMSVMASCVRQRGLGALGRLPLMATATALQQNVAQRRGIISKALREPGYQRPAPFPYTEKHYTFWRALLDDTTQRFDENSKIIVVDGPPTGNKDMFARQVAEELDMLYVPGANMDAIYLTEYGIDMRKYNDKMPYMMKSWDIHQFLKNPMHKFSTKLQFNMMVIRYRQYQNAINHVMNTGQGVVMNRSIYSDHVFMEMMAKMGYVSNTALDFYYECRSQGMYEFIRPHMVIYLDIPVEQVIKNVKARNKPGELNSPVYSVEALTALETAYKQDYLKSMNEHAEVLIYDWSEEGDAEVVVEDICRVDFDKYTKYDTKLKDWRFKDEWAIKEKRILFSYYKEYMEMSLNVPKMPVPALVVDGDALEKYNMALQNIPGNMYECGFNKDMGDKYSFKMFTNSKI